MENNEINVQQEIEGVKKDIEKLSSTDGWGKLSDKQKQYIQDSLYVSKRAYREVGTTNPRYGFRLSDELAILKEKEGKVPTLHSKYTESQNRISDWYCHYSVFVLENDGKTPNQPIKKVDNDFTNEEFKKYSTLADLETKIAGMEYPCVVQISERDDNSDFDVDEMIHSFVVFGKAPEGYLVWEKSDLGQTYKIKTLEELYKDVYEGEKEDYFYWGVRKLRKLT